MILKRNLRSKGPYLQKPGHLRVMSAMEMKKSSRVTLRFGLGASSKGTIPTVFGENVA